MEQLLNGTLAYGDEAGCCDGQHGHGSEAGCRCDGQEDRGSGAGCRCGGDEDCENQEAAADRESGDDDAADDMDARRGVSDEDREKAGNPEIPYRIVEKAAFTMLGLSRHFSGEDGFDQVTEYWKTFLSNPHRHVVGRFGVIFDANEEGFEYMIADSYQPWRDIPEKYESILLPAGMWAVFPCVGPFPQALRRVSDRVWHEWLQKQAVWRIAGNYSVEMYTPPEGNPENYYSELWIPVERMM